MSWLYLPPAAVQVHSYELSQPLWEGQGAVSDPGRRASRLDHTRCGPSRRPRWTPCVHLRRGRGRGRGRSSSNLHVLIERTKRSIRVEVGQPDRARDRNRPSRSAQLSHISDRGRRRPLTSPSVSKSQTAIIRGLGLSCVVGEGCRRDGRPGPSGGQLWVDGRGGGARPLFVLFSSLLFSSAHTRVLVLVLEHARSVMTNNRIAVIVD